MTMMSIPSGTVMLYSEAKQQYLQMLTNILSIGSNYIDDYRT